MSKSTDALFKPFTINKLTLSNRVVMAPMTREFSPEGVPTEGVADYYRRRAEGGTGLIITEGTTINDPVATMGERIPRFHGDAPLAGWENVVRGVHAAGGKIMPQLWHTAIWWISFFGPEPTSVPTPGAAAWPIAVALPLKS